MLGRTLGHYRLLDRLGAGGMGEVYRAEDLSLGRTVAHKVLPPEVAGDPERLERFRREARAVAALSHPHIVTLHSIEEADGVSFLTMELLDGETLERRIRPGGMAASEVLRHGAGLASALEAAHRHGIVHRDLKPGNIMLTAEGQAKILDFGVARQAAPAGSASASDATLTATGTLLGTVPYMAPEQLEGSPPDHRSDLFALGIVLYEMATGRHPFARRTPAETASAILRDDPPAIERARPELPRGLGRVIRRCLEKDPSRRYQTAADLALDLEELSRGTAPRRPQRRWTRVLAAAAAGLVAVLLALLLLRARVEQPSSVAREPGAGGQALLARRSLAQLTTGAGVEEWSAWSPDGGHLVYTAEIDGYRQLMVRDMATGGERRLGSGARDDIQPAFAPGGGAIYFVRSKAAGTRIEPADVLGVYAAGGDVWTLDLASGEERLVLESAFDPDVGPDGRLAFDASWAGAQRIWIADARGRNPVQLTTDASEAVDHATPRWSPDGRRIVFRRIEKTKNDIVVIEVASQATRRLTDDGFFDLDPTWTPDGQAVVFASYRSGGLNLWRLPVGADGSPAGSAEQLTNGAGPDVRPAVSPDGRRITFAVLPQNADLWRLPLDPADGSARGTPEALAATSREDSRGAWSPDGRQLAFNSDRSGETNLWLLSLTDGATRQLTRGAGGDYQPNWSPDGKTIAFFSARAGNADIWTVAVEDGSLTQLTDDAGLDINPFFSPDGRHIAFHSDRDGRLEVWMMNADRSEPRRLTSVGTIGHFLRWLPDGSLVFRSDGPRGRTIYRLQPASGELATLPDVDSGGHMSFSPDRSLVLDVSGHKTLRVFPLPGAPPRSVFEFDDPAVRIDYPVWSPDGRWVVFDRVAPQGGDVWMLAMG